MMKIIYSRFIIVILCALLIAPAALSTAGAAEKPGTKIKVYESALNISRLFDTEEINCAVKYLSETDEAALKIIEEKTAGGGAAYEVILTLGRGLQEMFKPLTPAESDFLVKNFNYSALRQSVKLIAAAAKFLSYKGKTAAAGRALFAACMMSIHFESAAEAARDSELSPLVTKMVSIACQKICFETLIVNVLECESAGNYFSNFYKTLEYINKSQFSIQKTLGNERSNIEKIIRLYASLDAEKVKELKEGAIYPPEVYSILAAEIKKSPFAMKVARLYTDEAIAQVSEIFSKYGEAAKLPFKDAFKALEEADKKLTSGGYNNFFTMVSIPNFNRANTMIARNHAFLAMAQTAALLKLYKNANKKFPDALSACAAAPAGLKLPKDPFTQEDFKYVKLPHGGFILISAGANMLIDGKYEGGFDPKDFRLGSSDDIVMTENSITSK
ncbi:MAG TPA: hypothetical protein PKW98_02905 [Candidatus Wallbacteria bacterium]|nr:hypothetical protein [Candidatus Wallbacteria bacterium]